ncbi:hypothetical protein ACLOJK_005914 [Asimina triloba]
MADHDEQEEYQGGEQSLGFGQGLEAQALLRLEAAFRVMTSIFEARSLKWFKTKAEFFYKYRVEGLYTLTQLVLAPLSKTMARIELLKYSETPKVYAMTMEEATEMEIHTRGALGGIV